MKKVIHSRILLFLFSIMLIMMIIPSASATIYSTDDFEADTTGANPSDSWYTYSEDQDFLVDNVTASVGYGGTKAFYLNDSNDAVVAHSNFTIDTTTYYDNFRFRFSISDADFHYKINMTILDSSSQVLGYSVIMNTTLYFNNSGGNIMSVTIENVSWYLLYIDFNLTTDRIGCYVYNESDSSTLLGYGWGDMEDGAGIYSDVKSMRFTSDASQNSSIYIDDLRLAYTYINPNTANNLAIVGAVTALFAVAVLLQIIAVAYSGQINPYSLAMLLVTVIIGVITLQIVAGL